VPQQQPSPRIGQAARIARRKRHRRRPPNRDRAVFSALYYLTDRILCDLAAPWGESA
jgi:hypothetical protein